MKFVSTCFLLFFSLCVYAQKTETLYLSGKGLGNTITWNFFCSNGHKSGKWSKIEVPSQWELQGFGEYTYGRWYKTKGAVPSMETGLYRYSFKVPAAWKGKSIRIYFDGVMTDTDVKINGMSAGDTHQGGFYRFSYDITDKIKYGAKNQLEVFVRKHSLNKSVNAAERMADWWTFGGIYRPVWLEAKPTSHIQHVAVDASSQGILSAKIQFNNLKKGCHLVASIAPIGTDRGTFLPQSISLQDTVSVQRISVNWKGVKTWTPETPNLYLMTLNLLNEKGEMIHTYQERIGFRTVEFKPKDGLYVNGTKVIMKGINRHSFHPDGGRTTNREISLQDALLIKEMNMNAVRFHYPPDTHFLEMCDSLGLFVIDELAGWQNSYDTTTGLKLQREMLLRDVNHPSIVLWSNGNEGGWNNALDQHFADYDIQKRHVIHPWADFNQLDTHHYPAYLTGVARFTNGYNVFMPTEFMHGQYDQGHGAGLQDFWDNYTRHPLFAGGFMWDFCDNAVKRADKGGILDSETFNAPDGILGPYREKEGSYYTVREVWSPIQIKKQYITSSFKGEFMLSNNYLFTNLSQCTMKYQIYAAPSPLKGGQQSLLASGEVVLPSLHPGETGRAVMQVPENFFEGDVLQLEAFDATGKSICNWTWPIHYAADYFQKQRTLISSDETALFTESDSTVTLSAKHVTVTFTKQDGKIISVLNSLNKQVPFKEGPVAVGMKMKPIRSTCRMDGTDAVFCVNYVGGVDSIVWRMSADGLLNMNAVLLNRASGGGGFDDAFMDEQVYNLGLTFSYPEEVCTGMRWFGRGPYRVWKNRVPGTNYGIWHKDYNNTITGESFENLVYPEFKGYHANLYWATIENKETPFTVYSASDGIFLRLFTPEEPKGRQDGVNTMPDFPAGDISFLFDIPAIRSFKPVSQHGPQSQPGSIRIKKGDEGIRLNLYFDFRNK